MSPPTPPPAAHHLRMRVRLMNTHTKKERERGGYLQQLPTNLPHNVATSLGGSCQSNVLIAQSLKRQSKWAGGQRGRADGAQFTCHSSPCLSLPLYLPPSPWLETNRSAFICPVDFSLIAWVIFLSPPLRPLRVSSYPSGTHLHARIFVIGCSTHSCVCPLNAGVCFLLVRIARCTRWHTGPGCGLVSRGAGAQGLRLGQSVGKNSMN